MVSEDGTIEFDLPCVKISRHMRREDFLNSSLFAISETQNQNEPWSRYGFKPVTAKREGYAGDICFLADSIYSISLCSTRPEFDTSWGDWTFEKEQARHAFHKKLLESFFCRPPDSTGQNGDAMYAFNWGTVSSITDIKTGDTSILIKYGRSNY